MRARPSCARHGRGRERARAQRVHTKRLVFKFASCAQRSRVPRSLSPRLRADGGAAESSAVIGEHLASSYHNRLWLRADFRPRLRPERVFSSLDLTTGQPAVRQQNQPCSPRPSLSFPPPICLEYVSTIRQSATRCGLGCSNVSIAIVMWLCPTWIAASPTQVRARARHGRRKTS